MPRNKIALDLIKYSGFPIAAPSANLSGKPSGTCFRHVFDDFEGKIAGIIKSKRCDIGLESTVIDLTTKNPVLLRPGAVSFEMLKKVLTNAEIHTHTNSVKTKSPGMKYKHYSPDARIILFESSAREDVSFYANKLKNEGKRVRVVSIKNIKEFSKNLFKIFRECDKKKIDYILISSVGETGIGLALMNRIRKAAFKIIKK